MAFNIAVGIHIMHPRLQTRAFCCLIHKNTYIQRQIQDFPLRELRFVGDRGESRFPVVVWTHLELGRRPLMWVFFSENVCKNERIGSYRGACAGIFCL